MEQDFLVGIWLSSKHSIFPLKIKFKKENFYPSWLHRKTESMSQYIFQKVKIKKAKSPKPRNVFIKKKKMKIR